MEKLLTLLLNLAISLFSIPYFEIDTESQPLKTNTCMHMVTFRAAITANMFGCSLELRYNTPGTRVGPGFYD